MHKTLTCSENTLPLKISPTNVLLFYCCNLRQAWHIVCDDERIDEDDDLRWRPGYSHHFSFIYRLPRPDDLDTSVVEVAIQAAEDGARHLSLGDKPWDGGAEMWGHWVKMRDGLILRTSEDVFYEWGEKYSLIKPELFRYQRGSEDVIENAFRSHADSYMQQVLAHVTNI
jgi:hypothetical protein